VNTLFAGLGLGALAAMTNLSGTKRRRRRRGRNPLLRADPDRGEEWPIRRTLVDSAVLFEIPTGVGREPFTYIFLVLWSANKPNHQDLDLLIDCSL
jgi:hypothetical protein